MRRYNTERKLLVNYYLIDYENVKTRGLDGISKLSEEDAVCIFYSEHADNLTFGLHRRINESQASIYFQRVEVGVKNALDFQLSSYLGYLICENKDNRDINYYIVTKDNGFSCLVSYWARKKVSVELVVDLSGRNANKEQEEMRQEVSKLIDDKDVVETVIQFMKQYKTKQGINNALMKKYPDKDNKKASEIYNLIKPLLADKKGK
ncbi:MAG: PIN domain-containing protein [Bacillota bacterium]|nr:PIN domain-containing protein [Bacillota bacterium]